MYVYQLEKYTHPSHNYFRQIFSFYSKNFLICKHIVTPFKSFPMKKLSTKQSIKTRNFLLNPGHLEILAVFVSEFCCSRMQTQIKIINRHLNSKTLHHMNLFLKAHLHALFSKDDSHTQHIWPNTHSSLMFWFLALVSLQRAQSTMYQKYPVGEPQHVSLFTRLLKRWNLYSSRHDIWRATIFTSLWKSVTRTSSEDGVGCHRQQHHNFYIDLLNLRKSLKSSDFVLGLVYIALCNDNKPRLFPIPKYPDI